MWQYVINNYVLDSDIIGDTIEHIREIESILKILFADKISDKDTTKPRLRWTVEEKFILLEAVLEHLPDSLPWSEIAEKFEERSPQRNASGCRSQWTREKEKGLIAWLLENKN